MRYILNKLFVYQIISKNWKKTTNNILPLSAINHMHKILIYQVSYASSQFNILNNNRILFALTRVSESSKQRTSQDDKLFG